MALRGGKCALRVGECPEFAFQVLEVTTREQRPSKKRQSVERIPLIHIWGVTEAAQSVLCVVSDFRPYFFASSPSEHDVSVFIRELEADVGQCVSLEERVQFASLVVSVEEVFGVRSVVDYAPRTGLHYFKVTVTSPALVPIARKTLLQKWNMQLYEADVQFVLRFMKDFHVVVGGWVEVPRGSYVVPENYCSECNLEVQMKTALALVPHPEWTAMTPFSVLSFDIECCSESGDFPDAHRDPVIQIANAVALHGKVLEPFDRTVFVLGTCEALPNGIGLLTCDSEAELLISWAQYVRDYDPDVIIGYNVNNFDLKYLLRRGETLSLGIEFSALGRLKYSSSYLNDRSMTSRAFGRRDISYAVIQGRVVIDMLEVMRRDHKLPSYTLNAVSKRFLGDQKEDMPYNKIPEFHKGSAADRRRLAIYTDKDALLPLHLFANQMTGFNFIEMARVTGLPISYLVERGQQVRVFSLLLSETRNNNMLIPFIEREEPDQNVRRKKAYTGATVIEPVRGFHENPIPTLDFASLYPSIMIAHNLCYTTLVCRDVPVVEPEWIATLRKYGLSRDDVETSPTNDTFVRAHVRRGLLPQILERLLSARRMARSGITQTDDLTLRAVLNGRQLALKIVANSVYGFTGAESAGRLPEVAISRSVTSYGRQMLELTRDVVLEHYTPNNGYEWKAKVTYGDTDSVMVDFGPVPLSRAIELGIEAAELVTRRFVPPIRLEFEKAYYPFLLLSKKRYAGLLWTNTTKYDRMDMKGIESIRRDNCRLVRETVQTILNKILIDRDVEAAMAHVKKTVQALCHQEFPLDMLIISKSLSRAPDQYVSRQPHVELFYKIKKRDPGNAPRIGDRVPYVIVQSFKNALVCQRAEDPIWALEKRIPIDYRWYIESQMRKPLSRIFAPLCDNVEHLFLTGSRVVQRTPLAGGIVGFLQVGRRCCVCNVPCGTTESVCEQCKPSERYRRKREQTETDIEDLSEKLRACVEVCTHCQGSDVSFICRNRDCSTFYERYRLTQELELHTEIMPKKKR